MPINKKMQKCVADVYIVMLSKKLGLHPWFDGSLSKLINRGMKIKRISKTNSMLG